jgi:hypothetical protein
MRKKMQYFVFVFLSLFFGLNYFDLGFLLICLVAFLATLFFAFRN